MRSVEPLQTRLTEEKCLDEVLRLQRGDAPCPACDQRAGFRPTAKRRAFACRDCGFQVYPTVDTPFSRPSPTLKQWFLAIYLAAGQGKLAARDLKAALDVSPKLAEELLDGISELKSGNYQTARGDDWFEAVREFTEAEADRAGPAGQLAPKGPVVSRALGSSDFRWHYIGVAGIALLACLGAGIGWLMVPDAPEEDQELVQATAILSLASDRPVILVSAEVAEQLYDVSDVEEEASSPLKASIRLAPVPGDAKELDGQAGKPLSRPSIKLAPSIGQSILKGDMSGVKGKTGTRPELAAYEALARELEARGPRNPDELLVFGPMKIRRHLVEKIIRAAREVQMDPVLLMAIADKESSFATEVQAQTSSATGLFQFIEKTWLGVVREFGAAHGLEKEAKLVQASLPAPERTRILELRRDAYLSALLAAEMLKRDSLRIQKRIGRPLTGGEIYLVHFLGPDGAERLLERAAQAPTAAAAELLPRPAEANKTIFYSTSADGAAKKLSVTEVRDKFETMISLRVERYRNVHGVALGATEKAVAKR
ncbi:MAG: hypothetical protein JWR08_52 [Enterovirga sp.]|nr:hypothetical protein [Enterovirga sp.]